MEEVPLHEDLRGEWGAQLRDRCLQDRGESPGSRSGGRLPVRERSPRPCLSFGDSIQGSQQGPLHLGRSQAESCSGSSREQCKVPAHSPFQMFPGP